MKNDQTNVGILILKTCKTTGKKDVTIIVFGSGRVIRSLSEKCHKGKLYSDDIMEEKSRGVYVALFREESEENSKLYAGIIKRGMIKLLLVISLTRSNLLNKRISKGKRHLTHEKYCSI